MPRSASNWPSAITKGVLPLPPTEIFPMLTTGRASFFTGKTSRSYKAFLIATPAPKMAESGFIDLSPAAAEGEPALSECGASPLHVWQIILLPGGPCAGVHLDDSTMRVTARQGFQPSRSLSRRCVQRD